jgi:hypothetical protein
MQSLNTIVNEAALKVPDYHLDHFQARVLEELHLEFFFVHCRFLITPSFRYVTTGKATPQEIAQLEGILAQRQELIGELKRYLMYGLTLYSALLETNSYHIVVNDHLVIARFVGLRDAFEVKLYTLRQEDLPARYEDKIYLGRDVLRLDRLERDHFGLRDMRHVLREQTMKLRRRLDEHAPESMRAQLERDYLGDLHELVEDFSKNAGQLLKDFPPAFPGDELDWRTLLEMNRRFRELKHRLVEADEMLRDMEKALFEEAPHAARYVTKLRKDVTNAENYILLKVNGRITDAVNGIRL